MKREKKHNESNSLEAKLRLPQQMAPVHRPQIASIFQLIAGVDGMKPSQQMVIRCDESNDCLIYHDPLGG